MKTSREISDAIKAAIEREMPGLANSGEVSIACVVYKHGSTLSFFHNTNHGHAAMLYQAGLDAALGIDPNLRFEQADKDLQ